MPDLLATSADTWRDRTLDPPAVPPELVPPRDASVRERLRALRRRHLLRERRARAVFQESRNPDRGWPVADNEAVVSFFRRLLRERRATFVAMVVLNALAAASGLLIPRLLGELIDRTVSGASSTSTVTSLALVILAVVAAQTLFTFAGQRTSTLFGQDLLHGPKKFKVQGVGKPISSIDGQTMSMEFLADLDLTDDRFLVGGPNAFTRFHTPNLMAMQNALGLDKRRFRHDDRVG